MPPEWAHNARIPISTRVRCSGHGSCALELMSGVPADVTKLGQRSAWDLRNQLKRQATSQTYMPRFQRFFGRPPLSSSGHERSFGRSEEVGGWECRGGPHIHGERVASNSEPRNRRHASVSLNGAVGDIFPEKAPPRPPHIVFLAQTCASTAVLS